MDNTSDLISVSTAGIKEKLNPLKIPCILNEIVSYLPASDLKNSRLVSHQWSEESLKYLQLKACIVLNSPEQVSECIPFLDNQNSSGFQSFKFGPDVSLESYSFHRLINKHGSQIKSIYLDKTKGSGGAFREVIFGKLPRLEELVLIPPDNVPQLFQLDEEIPELPTIKTLKLNPTLLDLKNSFFTQLLSAIPNVETISNPRDKAVHSISPDGMFALLQHIINEGITAFSEHILRQVPFRKNDIVLSHILFKVGNHHWKKLKKLDIHIVVDNSFLQLLESRDDLNDLQYIDIGLSSSGTIDAVNTLLTKLGKSLTSLKFTDYNFYQYDLSENFTCSKDLKLLQHLALSGYNGSLQFLTSIPHLQSLVLTRIDLMWLMSQDNFFLAEPHALKSLVVRNDVASDNGKRYDSSTKIELVEHLSECFPDLKTLGLQSITDEMLRCIISGWPNLEGLTALQGRFTDFGVTGIKPRAGKEHNSGNNLSNLEDCKDKRKFPFIAELKQLRKLELGSLKITDESIFQGILLCKNIRNLSLHAYGITDKSLEAIAVGMNLNSLTTEGCNKLTLPAVERVKEKMRGKLVSLNANSEQWKKKCIFAAANNASKSI